MTLLKIDLDTKSAQAEYKRRHEWVLNKLGLTVLSREISMSKGGEGLHVRLNVAEKLSDLETVLIQSILGSDYHRETYNAVRVRLNVRCWNVLHRP